eukprot:gene9752-biopygen1708
MAVLPNRCRHPRLYNLPGADSCRSTRDGGFVSPISGAALRTHSTAPPSPAPASRSVRSPPARSACLGSQGTGAGVARALARAWRGHWRGRGAGYRHFWLGWRGRGAGLSCDPWGHRTQARAWRGLDEAFFFGLNRKNVSGFPWI